MITAIKYSLESINRKFEQAEKYSINLKIGQLQLASMKSKRENNKEK